MFCGPIQQLLSESWTCEEGRTICVYTDGPANRTCIGVSGPSGTVCVSTDGPPPS